VKEVVKGDYMKKLVVFLVVFLCVCSSNVYAQNNDTPASGEGDTSIAQQDESTKDPEAEEENAKEEVTLDRYVVSVTRSDTEYTRFPAAIDVITSRDLEIKPKADNFYDAVSNVVGVQADQGSGMGWPSLNIRGARPTVLLEGITINPVVTGSPFNILTAGTGSVERLEILKGAQASTQGSGSMTGVINVVMKQGDPSDPYVKTKLYGGTNSTADGSFTVSGGQDKVAWFANYEQNYSGNYDTPKGRIPYTDSRFRNFYGRLDYLASSKQDLYFEMFYNDGQYQTGGQDYYYSGSLYGMDPRKIWQNKPQTTGLFGRYKGEFERCTVKATLGYIDNALDYVFGNPIYDVPSFQSKQNTVDMDEKSFVGDIRSQIDIIPDDKLTAHVNYFYKNDYVTADSVGGMPYDISSSYNQNSLVGQLESKPISHLLLIGGVRYDSYHIDENSIDNTSVNVGASIYPFANTEYDWTTLWASYSEAFKVPSALYLYLPFFGNPNLKSEKSHGWEVGIKQQFSHWADVEASYFSIDYDDLIAVDNMKLRNVDKAKTEGFEMQVNVYPVDHLTLNVNYLNMKRTNEQTGERLYAPQVPDSKLGFGGVLSDLYGFTLAIDGSYYITYKMSNGTKHPTQGKVVWNGKLSYEYFYKDFKIEPFIEVDNFSDELVYSSGDVVGIQPGRTFMAGASLTYSF
jgi:vitamin B12 transporter